MNKPDAYLVESIPLDLEDLRLPEGVAETKIALNVWLMGRGKRLTLRPFTGAC